MYRLDIFDETLFKPSTFMMSLDMMSATTNARQILKERIYADCLRANTQTSATSAPIVSPSDQEIALNSKSVKPTPKRHLDWQTEFDKAVEAFKHNGFMLFIDDRQISDLDETITLKEHDPSTVTFIKLIALQGG